MLGLITYLSTIFVFSPILNFLIFPALILFKTTDSIHKIYQWENQQIIGLFILFIASILVTFLFILFGPIVNNFESSIIGAFPYLNLITLSILVATLFDEQDLEVVFFLVLLEIVVGCIEYLYGTHSFFVEKKFMAEFGESNLMYYNRVYGLSDNSSVIAFKILVAWMYLLIFFDRYTKPLIYIFVTVLSAGLFITFNRTTIAAVMMAIVIALRNNKKWLFGMGLVVVVLAFIFWEDIMLQFSLGKEESNVRVGSILPLFLQFVVDNPFFGNNGAKVWFYMGNSPLYHAHNSFVELIASNGIPIATIFLFGYVLIIHKAWPVVVPVAVYSLGQYGIFWGFVFHDIVLTALFLHAENRDTNLRLGQ